MRKHLNGVREQVGEGLGKRNCGRRNCTGETVRRGGLSDSPKGRAPEEVGVGGAQGRGVWGLGLGARLSHLEVVMAKRCFS